MCLMTRRKPSIKLHPYLAAIVRDVTGGARSDAALHKAFRSIDLDPYRRSLLAKAALSTLRWYLLIAQEIRDRDPQAVCFAGSMVFLGELPKDDSIPWETRKSIKARVERSRRIAMIGKLVDAEAMNNGMALSANPPWLASLLEDYLGRDRALSVMKDSLVPPLRLYLRANELVATRDDVVKALIDNDLEAAPSKMDPNALSVPDGTRIDALAEFRSGSIEVQDLSSQIACRLALSGIRASRVVDACAGNGGKTLALSALMGNKGSLIAMDTNGRSLQRLQQRAKRAKAWNYQKVHVTGRESLGPYNGWADIVIVDAPCSGLGTLRRNPDIRLHLDPPAIEDLARMQGEILAGYSALVRPGGRLVYCTCTLTPQENEGVVSSFLSSNPAISLENAYDLSPGLPAEMFSGPYFRPLPGVENSGFFGAFMRCGQAREGLLPPS